MWEKISKILKGQIVTSIIYIAFGVCLVCMPVNMINVICKFVFGILLILVGLYHILIYVAEKLSATIFDLFSGGVLLVVGVFLFMNPQIVIKLLPVLLGTFILVDSIWTLKGSFRLKKRNMGTWKFLLIGSLIFIGLGIALVVNPFTMAKYMVIFAGYIFLVNGILDLIFMILLKKGLKELKQDLEAVDAEGEFTDEESSDAPEDLPDPEPEYTPWSQREEVWNTTQNDTSSPSEEPEAEEDSTTSDQPQDNPAESTISEEPEATDENTTSFHLTDDDLSDTKDEKVFSFLRKNKRSREEDK